MWLLSALLLQLVFAPIPLDNQAGNIQTRTPPKENIQQAPVRQPTDSTSDSSVEIAPVNARSPTVPDSAKTQPRATSAVSDKERQEALAAFKKWSYSYETGPTFWSSLHKEFRLCAFGRAQSPINIQNFNSIYDPESHQLSPLLFNYQRSEGKKKVAKQEGKREIDVVKNDGRSLTFMYPQGSYMQMTPQGERFELISFHFHSPSEHLINNKRQAAELQMVHRSHDGRLATVAVLYKLGSNNEWLDSLQWDALPVKGEQSGIHGSFNAAGALPFDRNYYYYHGSLTTPPCTEGVNWFVMKSIETMSQRQYDMLRSVYNYKPNNRPVQPLFDRRVFSSNTLPDIFSSFKQQPNKDAQESFLEREKLKEQRNVIFTSHLCGCQSCPCENSCGCNQCPCQVPKMHCGHIQPCFYHTKAAFSHQALRVLGHGGGKNAFEEAKDTRKSAEAHLKTLKDHVKDVTGRDKKLQLQLNYLKEQVANAEKVLTAAKTAEKTAKTQVDLEKKQAKAEENKVEAKEKAEKAKADAEAAALKAKLTAHQKELEAAQKALDEVRKKGEKLHKPKVLIKTSCECSACPCTGTHMSADTAPQKFSTSCGCGTCPCQKVHVFSSRVSIAPPTGGMHSLSTMHTGCGCGECPCKSVYTCGCPVCPCAGAKGFVRPEMRGSSVNDVIPDAHEAEPSKAPLAK